MRAFWLMGLLLMGCGAGGTAAEPETGAATPAPAEPTEPKTPGARCLADARAPRTPKDSAPASIGVSHILIRHAELRDPRGATRSREQACLRALEARKKLEASGDWDAVVDEYSDAAGATKGALGTVSRDQLDSTFADAAFALDVNELSYVVETERGFHIIVRTE